MFRFSESDIREQKKHEKRIQISVENTVNDLRCEVKFENRVQDQNCFFLKMQGAYKLWNLEDFGKKLSRCGLLKTLI